MNDWKEIKLGEIANFRNGLNFDKDSNGKGYKIIGVSNFGDKLRPEYSSLSEIKPVNKLKADDYLKIGDVVFVRSNGNKELVGRSMYIDSDIDNLVFSGFCIRARFISEEVFPLFYAYFFRTDLFRKTISASSGGSNIQNLNQVLLSNSKTFLPPLETQKKIASILSAYDDLMENNLRRIKLLEEMASITYKEWFVNFRIDGQALEIDKETGLPFGWEWKEFQFFGEIITGKTPPTSERKYFDGNIPFIKTPDMSDMPYVLETTQTLSEEGGNIQKNKFIPKNSLMISCIGTAGTFALASTDSQTNQQINSIKFKEEYYSFYFYCIAQTLKPLLEALGSNGATMTNVNKGKFEKIKAIYPNSHILVEFHNLVKGNFEMILNLQTQNHLLKEARDILLPRLMNGTIAV